MTAQTVLTERDYTLFNDISRFGFTTTDHFILRFSSNIKQASRRFLKLARSNYLKNIGLSVATKKKLYIPGKRFFKICPFSEVTKLNIKNIKHDEYLLMLFSLLENNRWGDKIILEQDLEKESHSKGGFLRIPDLIMQFNGGNFVFEYERSLKSDAEYEKMRRAFRSEDEDSNYFVFLCETRKIAEKINEKVNLNHMSVVKPQEFLEILKAEKYERLIDYIKHETVNYF